MPAQWHHAHWAPCHCRWLSRLGAARVQMAASYLEGYVGRERLAEFVRLHPQSLLWMPDEASPAAQHLSMLGLPEALIKRVQP